MRSGRWWKRDPAGDPGSVGCRRGASLRRFAARAVPSRRGGRRRAPACPRETIERMAGSGAHQGVVARYRRSAATPIVTLDQLLGRTPAPSLVVVLDEVQDPRNLGACMRCAAGAGGGCGGGPEAPERLPHGGRPARPEAVRPDRLPLVVVPNLANALGLIAEAGARGARDGRGRGSNHSTTSISGRRTPSCSAARSAACAGSPARSAGRSSRFRCTARWRA